MNTGHFAAPLQGARLILGLYPGLRFACPGLLSFGPYGAGDLLGWLSQDCAAIVLGYYPSAPPGRFFTVRNVHFRRNPPTRVKLLPMNRALELCGFPPIA